MTDLASSLHLISSETLIRWMDEVLQCGWAGVEQGQNPFAAAVYREDGTRLSIAHNTVNQTNEPTRHGEVNAIDAACRALGSTNLQGCWLVTTGEPCPMCAAAAAIAKISHIAVGADHRLVREAGFGNSGVSLDEFVNISSYAPTIVRGICRDECRRFLNREK